MATKKAASEKKYGAAASKSVEREMKAMHEGTLTIGKSDKKVTNPKQAIAIGLSEARKAGGKVPPDPNRPAKKAVKKASPKKSVAKKAVARKSAAKKSGKKA